MDQKNYSSRIPGSVISRLEQRRDSDSLRQLWHGRGLVDFSSNDYLGFSTTGLLRDRLKSVGRSSEPFVGSMGSRLLSGNSEQFEELEELLAGFHDAESALIFNSGYDANLGLLSSLPTRHDTVLYDELCHASIIDGVRLSLAKHRWSFKHNDLEDLRRRAQRARGQLYIVVESVYSMDGDLSPLRELAKLAGECGASLIVDEAHATGIFGEQGAGRVCELGLTEEVLARVHTFGKALGAHGAAVVGPRLLKEYLVNFARSFIYTTALDAHALTSIKEAYGLLQSGAAATKQLFTLIKDFHEEAGPRFSQGLLANPSPIQALLVPNNEKAKKVSSALRQRGIDARPILHPTVPRGKERLRICLHTFNTREQIAQLLNTASELL